MKRPSFNEKTLVKVIKHLQCIETYDDAYGWRGIVIAIDGFKTSIDADGQTYYKKLTSPYSLDCYPDVWSVSVLFKEHNVILVFDDWETELEPVQKKFIDIENLREHEIDLGVVNEDGTHAIRPANTVAFELGNLIQITTKIDGANASIAWDSTTGQLEVFSRTNLLTSPDALHGFFSYVKSNIEPKTDWSQYAGLTFFGEWCIKHTVKYNADWYNHWRVYDIYDTKRSNYLPQEIVKSLCKTIGLEYIEVLYEGPFISWDHCRSFLGKSVAYGPQQEGIVIKNQTMLDRTDIKSPKYLKIVDEKFKESQHSAKPIKEVDPTKEAEKTAAYKLIESIVTQVRVKKTILKLVDEGILPFELKPTDIGTCMKHLPRLVFDDIVKEEHETVAAAGKYAGKACAAIVSKHVKEIILGEV